jgi:hypothetical protein
MSLAISRASLVVLAAIVGTAGSAFADTVTMHFSNVSPGASVKYKVNGSSVNTTGGVMNFTVNSESDTAETPSQVNPFTNLVGDSITTFCINAAQTLHTNDTYTIAYQPFSDNPATLLQELYAAHFADIGSSTTNAAAFQMAVWEIVYDAPNSGAYTYNNGLTGGLFQDNGSTSAIVSEANTFLSNFQTLGAAKASNWTLYELNSSSGQSQLYAVNNPTTNTPAVPLPAAAPEGMLLLAGMAGVGAFKKLRKA